MSKKEKEFTPSDKARRFTLGSVARVGACLYLIYVIITLIKGAIKGDVDIPMPIVIAVAVVFALVGGFLIFITIQEVVRGVKNKEYSMHKYYNDELTAQGLKYNSRGELVPIDTPDEEEPEEDEYDNEEYDEDDEYYEDEDFEEEESEEE